MNKVTMLEKLLFRLEAQHACLGWAFGEIANLPGVVFEMGLGHGRTYDHLRTYLPERDIYVFDRQVDCFPDCTPPDDRLFLGEISDTLAEAGRGRFSGNVILAHADMGSRDKAHNITMSAKLGERLPPVLAPRAIVVSDLPLELAGVRRLPLPPGAREDRYFLYRKE